MVQSTYCWQIKMFVALTGEALASEVSTSIMRDVNNNVFITFITFNSTEIFHEHKIILILYASLHYTLSNIV